MIQEGLQVFLHLNGVVLGLGHGEDPHPTLLPGPVLLQEEGQQHQQTAIMHNPPDVDESLKYYIIIFQPHYGYSVR